MRQLADLVLAGQVDGALGGNHAALALQGADLNDGAAKSLFQLGRVDLVTVLADQIHHVDGNDHRDAQLQQLGGEVKVALDVGAVDDIQNSVRAVIDQILTGDDLLQRVGRQRIDARQVLDDDLLVALQNALLALDGDARPVADVLIRAGKIIEQRGLAAVGVTR